MAIVAEIVGLPAETGPGKVWANGIIVRLARISARPNRENECPEKWGWAPKLRRPYGFGFGLKATYATSMTLTRESIRAPRL